MIRSLLAITLAVVGGVVLALGAGVLAWITAEDLRESRQDADRQHEAAEGVLRRLVEGADRRLRLWIAEEPLGLYRDPVPPHALDVEALRRGLTAEVRARSLAESEHVDVVSEALRHESEVRAEAATDRRRDRLALRLGLLLLGMAALLGVTLYVLVLAPVRRLRGEVDRIARGDLVTPLAQRGWPAREMGALARDVDRMREQVRVATQDLEAEVERKTRTLAATLEERTRALEELRATRDRLVQAEKMAGLGTLAGGVAHEFNNLLGGILGCLESARAGSTDASVLEDLDVARRTARRATDLVGALLGVARPGERRFREVALATVLDQVRRAALPGAERRGVGIREEIRGAPVVRGDEAQLHQVVLNLVTNAIQAVDDGEAIVLALREEEGQAVVEVRDEGPGVPPRDRPRLFEPFFTRRGGGTGLGLFVSYGIVERHGGRIEVGEAPEGGARFTVRLPLARAEDTSAS